jgi:hypothetical protein
MPARNIRKSTSLAVKAAQLSVAVPQVVAHRVTRMALAGTTLSPRDRKEFDLMVREKQAAFTEAFAAMALQTVRANQAMATTMLRSLWSVPVRGRSSPGALGTPLGTHMHAAMLGVLAKGMAPIHRKAVANAKRLAKTKLR